MSTPANRGFAVAVASALVLSTTAVLIRHLTVTWDLPPLVLAFWRNAFVVATLGPALALARPGAWRRGLPHLRFLAVYGVVLAAFNALWTFSVARCGAGIATVLVYTSGAGTCLLGFLVLGERLGRAKLAAVVLCLAGCALVSGASGAQAKDGAGLAAGLLSGAGYAVYSVMGATAARRGLDPWTTVLYTFGFAAAALLVPLAVASPGELLWLGGDMAGWGTLLLLAAGPTVVGFGLYGASLAMLPSSVANLIATTEPAFTVAIAWAFLGERLTAAEIAGGAVIVGGVALLRARAR